MEMAKAIGIPLAAPSIVSKQLRNFWARCVQEVHRMQQRSAGRPTRVDATVRDGRNARSRYMRLVGAGRPKIMLEVGYLLYQWFVDVRYSIKGRLSRAHVLAMASQLVHQASLLMALRFCFQRIVSSGGNVQVPCHSRSQKLCFRILGRNASALPCNQQPRLLVLLLILERHAFLHRHKYREHQSA